MACAAPASASIARSVPRGTTMTGQAARWIEPARDAAEQHAAERAVAARAADEQVDVVAELLERGDGVLFTSTSQCGRHRRLEAVERRRAAVPRPARGDAVEVGVARRRAARGSWRSTRSARPRSRRAARAPHADASAAAARSASWPSSLSTKAAPMRSMPRMRSAKPSRRDRDRARRAVQQPVGGASERDAARDAVVGRADDEQGGAPVLRDVVEDAGRRRSGDGHRLERDAMERGLDRGQAGEGGAAELLLDRPPPRKRRGTSAG